MSAHIGTLAGLKTPKDAIDVHEDRVTAIDRRTAKRGKAGNQAWRLEIAPYLVR